MTVLKNNQNEIEFYRNQLGVTNDNITDLEHAYLLNELSLTSGNTTDMWIEWLLANGATSTNENKAWSQFLISVGYDGNLPDDQVQYFIDNS